ncbi:MAG: dTDP-4-dehydrorhamnose 3,5-epimerase family protein [Deltaproteobacteria bacterium]|nr:dTDP-4-dehydrorhamnose 3,5-epimerase family protein [Deltaproteobacteria bacterium]MBW2121125.1 dTDP-4-dehydrorhamnose 3,5-epimerase family protein [Deltaproteobacteria bacterium]
MIEGVVTKSLRVIPDERGRLMEILRTDDPLFRGFGQVYMTTTYPGVVKAWHYHKKQTDNVAVVRGMIKIALYDPREDSPTRGEVNEFFVGEHAPALVQIPPRVFHGWKCIGEYEAIIVNIPTEVYNYQDPDEFRVHPHENDIPYDWSRQDG